MLLVLLASVLVSCENYDFDKPKSKEKVITFHVNHFYETRATLSGDGGDLTDLWLFDYLNGELVQTIHQTNTDEDFGEPSISLSYGSHHVYFVASRGADASVNTTSHIISWSTVRDTFWKDYAVDVTATMESNRTVTLDRMVARLRLTVNDEVPATTSKINFTADKWYYALNYMTGAAAEQGVRNTDISISTSYLGTSGNLVISAYTISDAEGWNLTATLTAYDDGNDILGQATIGDIPMKRNRITSYSGNLFNSSGLMSIGLNTEWEPEYTGIW